MVDEVVVRGFQRVEPGVIARMAEAGVATVSEAAGGVGLVDPVIRPIQSGTRIGGSAVTVSCAPGDNIMVHAAIEVIEPGDVLVVTTTSPSDHGMFGELLATSASHRGCVGLIMDGAVRDVAELRGMGFPVWARLIHAKGTVKKTPGSVNVPVECAGVTVHPGDVIVADDDGVIAVERLRAAEVTHAARSRMEREEETRRRLASGELSADLYGFRELLLGKGVRWIDTTEG